MLSSARAVYTQPVLDFKQGTMIGTHDIIPVLVQKNVGEPVQRSRGMWTGIFVNKNPFVFFDDENVQLHLVNGDDQPFTTRVL